MIQCETIYSTAENKAINPMSDYAIVKELEKEDRYYLIDTWRHALDENEDRIGNLSKYDRCQIEEWHLELSQVELRFLFTAMQQEFNW